MYLKPKKALLVVDVQNDFCPGGALAVPAGDEIIAILNKYIRLFLKFKLPIFASRDWHPKETKHFKNFGGDWPEHCVSNTKGAEFAAKLALPKETIIISKGMNPEKDSYSAFDAEDDKGNDFFTLLKALKIEQIYVAGLATDYCVRSSVLDALNKGFKVKLLVDAIRGVDVKKGDSQRAIKEMASCGAGRVTFNLADIKRA